VSTGEKTADFIDRLDAAIGCMYCGGELPPNAVSDYFCAEECSAAYAASNTAWHGDYIDDDEEWSPEALVDLEPVGWIQPPVWRLPRSTSDLDADQLALNRACETVQTPAQQAACDLRQDDIDQRRRRANAKNWRLPRSTGNFWADDRACHEAAAMATTDAQRAACVLRREDLEARRPSAGMPGRRTSWGLDNFVFSPLRDLPIVTTEQAQRAADAILARYRPSDPDYSDATSFGTRMENRLPGIRPATIQVRGISAPRMLAYELRRDSDGELLLTHVTPYHEGVTWRWTPPMDFDLNGTHMRVLDNGREIARHQIIDSRTRRAAPTWEFDDSTAPQVRGLTADKRPSRPSEESA
jgi:hypothetical protein